MVYKQNIWIREKKFENALYILSVHLCLRLVMYTEHTLVELCVSRTLYDVEELVDRLLFREMRVKDLSI